MTDTTEPAERARRAVAEGDWHHAYKLLADESRSLGAEELELFATAAYGAGHLDAALEALERAHAAHLRAGDTLAAAGAAARVAMHLVIDTGLMAPVRAWVRRAERLLAGAPTGGVHAWLGVASAYDRLLSGDFGAAREHALAAVEAGSAHDEPSAAAVGRVAAARCDIFEGNVEDGLRLLDDAAVSTSSGELDPFTTGLVYCEIVCAWQGLAMYDRAEEWTQAMERFSASNAIGSVGGRCRLHRAEILRLRGDARGAELEAMAACEELRPYMKHEFGWPLTELGRIRLQLDDLAGAEDAFLAAHEKGWEPQPGLALLRLAQGDTTAAQRMITAALNAPLDVPSKELPPSNDLRRAPLLEAQVEIAAAAGDGPTARTAAAELARIAAATPSTALKASAAHAAGVVELLDGSASSAERSLRTAVRLWSEIAAPYEAAASRVALARALRAADNDDDAVLELRAAAQVFARVGASARAARAEQEAGGAAAAPPTRRLRLEGDVWTVDFEGRSALVRDMKGLRHIARLISAPGRELHVMDLVGIEHGTLAGQGRSAEGLAATRLGDAGPLLDDQAKASYRRRITEIDEDIAEADALNDDARRARAEAERDFLLRELSRAVGLGGRDRRAGAPSERARASVTRAIRYAVDRVREHHPELAAHLDRSVRTGTFCAYQAEPGMPAWTIEGA